MKKSIKRIVCDINIIVLSTHFNQYPKFYDIWIISFIRLHPSSTLNFPHPEPDLHNPTPPSALPQNCQTAPIYDDKPQKKEREITNGRPGVDFSRTCVRRPSRQCLPSITGLVRVCLPPLRPSKPSPGGGLTTRWIRSSRLFGVCRSTSRVRSVVFLWSFYKFFYMEFI